jgi:predicted MFS family arabinose efflux permease
MTQGVRPRQRLAVFSVALGTFTLVTNEFRPEHAESSRKAS